MHVLKEVFDFYCKQHIKVGGINNSFADLGEQLTTMTVSDWMFFCRDFNLKSE